MNVLIRVDAGVRIGSGHVARTLTMADALKRRGVGAHFVCRKHFGHLESWIKSRGFSVTMLPLEIQSPSDNHQPYAEWLGAPADLDVEQTLAVARQGKYEWAITDHYAIDEAWHSRIRTVVPHVLAIDDLANRKHDADVVLDQNYHHDFANRYDNLVPESCVRLLGPQYTLLRPQFEQSRHKLSKLKSVKRSDIENWMVFMGGMDEQNVTSMVLQAFQMEPIESLIEPGQLRIHTVIGSSNPHLSQVVRICRQITSRERIQAKLHVQVDDMAGLMSQMDFAVAAGGTNTWERCCLGLPTAVVTVAENQVQVARDLDSAGVSCFIGQHDQLNSKLLATALADQWVHRDRRITMRQRSLELVDGGGTTRVSERILSDRNRVAA
jgi:UDP-2,4-diacetamido-2,4,6-trideoxy-beta-L-altropyranose hydrolase